MSRLLIIEDEEAIAELEKDYLELSGFDVEIENNGQSGMDRALHEEFDLFILDLMLPEIDGFEICKRIRKQKNTPILMVSAKKDAIDKIRGLGLGADDYITKPFSPKELVLRVNNLMRRVYRDEDKYLSVDGYDIDENQRTVVEGSTQIELTTKEFDLLMMFVNNRGKAFPREKILEQVWEENYFGSDRVVDDTLRRLRKKMPNLSIKTIYGFGYKLG